MTINDILNFIIVKEIVVWQELFWSAILIPFSIYFWYEIREWWIGRKPLNLLYKGFKSSSPIISVFVSQMSHADAVWNRTPNPHYIESYPCPTPTDQNRQCKINKLNIDPVWSEAEGLCVADLFGSLGQAGIIEGVKIVDLIKDWNLRNSPMISVGFTSKTRELVKECAPINYVFQETGTATLRIDGGDDKLDSIFPNDAGIIQKTCFRNSEIPVLILAGLGTTATAVAGYVWRENAVELGKLYGAKPFCILFKSNIQKGRQFYEIIGAFPKPLVRAVFHYPVTYWKWRKRNIFSKNNNRTTAAPTT